MAADGVGGEDISRKRLGRGLAALIGEIDRPAAIPPRADRDAPIELIERNPRNPRRRFGEAELDELAQSIRQHGIVQPVVVRPASGRAGHFEIIAGERRWRAAQRAGLSTIPVLVRDLDDRAALEIAIVENVQRADLNPVEEAQGYQQLVDGHAYTQNDLATIVGKSRSHVANTLRLLKLPQPVLDMLEDGSLSAGHARTLVTADDPAGVARRIVKEGLSVRQADALAQSPNAESPAIGPKRTVESTPHKDADTRALEKRLADATGLDVRIDYGAQGGAVRISYKTLEQLDLICRKLAG
ncbi:MAG: ParB/RepB/Spo0J family partition protein [Phyllobacteriaceae bacterium]|nr:ParB/RepB/Spo0J family partition protein [Phyllobacteriaceae bacterium]